MDINEKKTAKDSGDGKKLPPWLQGKAPKTGAASAGSSKTTKGKKDTGKKMKKGC